MTALRRLWPQPLLATAAITAALGGLAGAWLITGPAALRDDPAGFGVLAVIFGGMLVATYPITIHVRQNTKTQVTTVLVYLLTVMIPVPLAATGVLVSMCLGELRVRKQRGT